MVIVKVALPRHCGFYYHHLGQNPSSHCGLGLILLSPVASAAFQLLPSLC